LLPTSPDSPKLQPLMHTELVNKPSPQHHPLNAFFSPNPRLPMPMTMRPATPSKRPSYRYLSSSGLTPSSPQTPTPVSNTTAPRPQPPSPQASISQPCSPAAPSAPAGRHSPSGTIPSMRRLRSVGLVSFRVAQDDAGRARRPERRGEEVRCSR